MAGCRRPASDEYVTRICTVGDIRKAGTNSLVAKCKKPGKGEYTTRTCTQGDYRATTGTISAVAGCGTCGKGQRMTGACTAGSHTALGSPTACGKCPAGQYHDSASHVDGSSSAQPWPTVRCDLAA